MEHKELYFEGTQVKANADLDSLVPRFAVEARAAIQEHLAAHFPDTDTKPEQQQAVVGCFLSDVFIPPLEEWPFLLPIGPACSMLTKQCIPLADELGE